LNLPLAPCPVVEMDAARTPEAKQNTMRFIEITGKTLAKIVNQGELKLADLQAAGITEDAVVRINEQGDIEVRRSDQWDLVGGLLGDYKERVRRVSGLDWV
jgi:hypothetical protein